VAQKHGGPPLRGDGQLRGRSEGDANDILLETGEMLYLRYLVLGVGISQELCKKQCLTEENYLILELTSAVGKVK
jgi:hypothetical protein